MAKKRAPSSIPDSLKPLYRNSQRIRFHGGWLGESEMDRTIAEWLDELPARDAWAIVKTILYTYITGRTVDGAPPAPRAVDAGEFGRVSQALLEIDD